MDIAVIGAGISGLSCAWKLRREGCVPSQPDVPPNVTLYEANDHAGGHTHTVDAEVDGIRYPVDTGFLVFNHRTYPRLVALFDELGVQTAPSEMSFSVKLAGRGARAIEWAGTDLNSVFIQRRNLFDPGFLRMLADLLRFNRQTMALVQNATRYGHHGAIDTWTLGEFLDAHRYSRVFRDWYLLPMAAAIWSCSTAQMREFPLSTFVRFCANHGLLQIVDRPQWYTVKGGARNYVERLLAVLPDVRIGEPAIRVARVRSIGVSKVAVVSGRGAAEWTTALYDHVVLACHSDQSLALLEGAERDERALLSAVRYQPNRAILHTDASVLPSRRGAWAAWNYQCDIGSLAPDDRAVCVHYLINKLQPVPFERPVILSLNPTRPVEPASILGEFEYAHPVFDGCAINAQRRLPDIQGRGNVWYCGAWTGYGFHEDGLKSGIEVAEAIRARGFRSDQPTTSEARLAA
ncbi:MAG: NAD(P)/FAD-dependent oxidoreductase [Burkholderiaceae bacterium]